MVSREGWTGRATAEERKEEGDGGR